MITCKDGSNIEQLSNGSHKLILFNCDTCGTTVEQSYRNYLNQKDGKFCRKCRNKHTANREDVKQKQSITTKKMWLNDDYRTNVSKKISDIRKKEWSENKRKVSNKTNYNTVKDLVEHEGYTLITNEIDYNKKGNSILVKCSCGKIFPTFYTKWILGHRCPICAIKITSDKNRFSYDEIKEFVESTGYILLSNNYNKNTDYLTVRCPNKHEPYNVMFRSFKSGTRCPMCYIENANDDKRHNYDYIKTYIEGFGYGLLSKEYKNNHSHLRLKCSNGHQFNMRFGNFKNGRQRCPICSTKQSPTEIDIIKNIKTYYSGLIIENDRSVVKNPHTKRMLELDIYLPEINLAIECNSYFHKRKDMILKDELKEKVCSERGIILCTIWYDDWIKKRDVVYNEIRNIITTKVTSM